MQYGHCVVSATATAISSLYLSGIAPSLNAASSNATNPLKASGASSPSFLSLVMFFMSYIAVSLGRKSSRSFAGDSTGQPTPQRQRDLQNQLQGASDELAHAIGPAGSLPHPALERHFS